MTKVLETGFKVWAIGIGAIAIVGFVYAIVQLVTGNFHSTTAFEF
jgi:hypothetical protein